MEHLGDLDMGRIVCFVFLLAIPFHSVFPRVWLSAQHPVMVISKEVLRPLTRDVTLNGIPNLSISVSGLQNGGNYGNSTSGCPRIPAQ